MDLHRPVARHAALALPFIPTARAAPPGTVSALNPAARRHSRAKAYGDGGGLSEGGIVGGAEAHCSSTVTTGADVTWPGCGDWSMTRHCGPGWLGGPVKLGTTWTPAAAAAPWAAGHGIPINAGTVTAGSAVGLPEDDDSGPPVVAEGEVTTGLSPDDSCGAGSPLHPASATPASSSSAIDDLIVERSTAYGPAQRACHRPPASAAGGTDRDDAQP